MRVWLVTVGEEIPDDPGDPRLLRTAILAGELAARGHEVVFWTGSFNHQRKFQRTVGPGELHSVRGFSYQLLYGRSYSKNISLARVVSHRQNARDFADRAARLPQPDLIVSAYPTIELAGAVTKFAVDRKIPVVVDVRDMWPEIIEDAVSPVLRAAFWPVFAHWRRTQVQVVRRATAVIGVTDPFVTWALQRAQRRRGDDDRAFHLAIDPKGPMRAEAFAGCRARNTEPAARCPLVGVAAGAISTRSDLETIVEGALELDADDRKQLTIYVCGSGDLEKRLRKRVGGDPCIVFTGWLTAGRLQRLLASADFGIVAHRSTPDYRINYPNKVGECLAAGLPIMTGLQGLTREMLESRGIGLFYDEGDPGSAAACLRALLRERPDFAPQRVAALQAFHELFDPEVIYPQLCDFLESVGSTVRST